MHVGCANIAHMRPICTDVMLFYTLQGCHTSVENVQNILSMQGNAINMRKHAIKCFIVISPIRGNYLWIIVIVIINVRNLENGWL